MDYKTKILLAVFTAGIIAVVSGCLANDNKPQQEVTIRYLSLLGRSRAL